MFVLGGMYTDSYKIGWVDTLTVFRQVFHDTHLEDDLGPCFVEL
jgi:hypothetical protein